jgi:hypothetical protein
MMTLIAGEASVAKAAKQYAVVPSAMDGSAQC